MMLKSEVELIEEVKRISKEVESMKNYLAKIIELNIQQMKTVKPTLSEKKIFETPILKKEFLKWDEIEDEI